MSESHLNISQVSIDFPHKFYMGSFGRESRFDVTADEDGVHIHLDRVGEERRGQTPAAPGRDSES